MSHSRPSQAGFSLLEVMIAMAVMAIAISSIFGAMGTASQISEAATNRDNALKQIQNVIEKIKPTAFDNLNGHEGWFDVAGLSAPPGRQRVMQVWPVDEGGTNATDRLRHNRLRCEWIDLSGVQFYEIEYYSAHTN